MGEIGLIGLECLWVACYFPGVLVCFVFVAFCFKVSPLVGVLRGRVSLKFGVA